MHTEEEAKTLWCPMAGEPRITRQSEDCIGSRCATWRWLDPEIQQFRAYEMGQTPDGDGWKCTMPDTGREKMTIKSFWERPNPDRKGYCGLAGKPEVM